CARVRLGILVDCYFDVW
nr:immunoglobulin heavy chain junction region [Macaca mulatta]